MGRAKQRNRYTGAQGAGDELEMKQQELENEAHAAMESGRHGMRVAQRSVLAAFDAFGIFGDPMTRLMDHNRALLQKVLRAMHEELLRFVNRRLEHTSHTIESSRDCHGISGLMAVQQEWMLEFARDYAEQAKRFAELTREFAEGGTATLSRVSSEAMERSESEEHRAAA